MRTPDPCRRFTPFVTPAVQEPRCVILSEAKDHLATFDPRKEILRFAQDDRLRSRQVALREQPLHTRQAVAEGLPKSTQRTADPDDGRGL